MKTKSSFSSRMKNLMHHAMCFLATVILFSFGAVSAQGQKLHPGMSLSGIVSGSGVGQSLSPQFTLNNERHTFSAGITIQSRNSNFTGLRGRYEYIINLNPEKSIDIFLYYDIAWHYRAFLGSKIAARESALNPESAGYFYNAKVKPIEQHIGFGLNIYVFDFMKIFGAVGAGYYYTLDSEQQNLFQYRTRDDFSLMCTAGLKFNLKKTK